ncbi:MAG: MCE family protein [Actinomycetota bacterium]|nr:MCE family protein [Actinomycetota bacterium]
MRLTKRNTVTVVSAIKLGIFTVISVLVTGLLAAIMGHFGFGSQTEYKAIFSTASELKSGDDVRVAGVSVGEVKNVEIYHRNNALVTFKVRSDVPMTTASQVDIRFLNLVGSRYMSIAQGPPGATPLAKGATIPMTHTQPSLNLSALFNGFQPLFAALNPHDVNQLSLNLVRTLQGEGGTVQSLLANTASLTNTLADRDKLIGDVIHNLSGLLGTVDSRRTQLNELIIQLKGWMTNLATDRHTIGASIQNLSSFTDELAGLLTQSRPYLKQDVAELRRVMTILAKPSNKAILNETLHRLPKSLSRQTRTGTYGSWYNYYLCDFEGKILLPPTAPPLLQQELQNLSFHSTSKRCN